MADLHVCMVLNQWGFGKYIAKFREKKIGEGKLRNLSADEMFALIENADIPTFLTHFQKYLQTPPDHRPGSSGICYESDNNGNQDENENIPSVYSGVDVDILGSDELLPNFFVSLAPPSSKENIPPVSVACQAGKSTANIVQPESSSGVDSVSVQGEPTPKRQRVLASAISQPKPKPTKDYSSEIAELQKFFNNNAFAQVALLQAKKSSLSEHQRVRLSEIIVGSLLSGNAGKRIEGSKFSDLSEAICILLDHETCPGLYYQPYMKSEAGKKRSARGHLVSAYYKLRNENNQATKGSNVPNADENDSESEEPKEDTSVLWLRNHLEPFPEAIKHWEKTHKFRMAELKKSAPLQQQPNKNLPSGNVQKKIKIADYLDSYPVLKAPLGYTLLDLDFKLLFGEDKQLKIYSGAWEAFCEKAHEVLKNIKKPSYELQRSLENIEDHISNGVCAKDYSPHILMNLGILCSPFTVSKKSSKSKEYRPSKAEIQSQFFTHVTDLGKLHETISLYQKKIHQFQLTCQPYPIMVGRNLDNITHSFVCVDNHRYQVENPLKALDICFKLYFALDTDYPPESQALWLLIQRVIYDIPLSFSQKADSTLSNALRLFQLFNLQ